jgi:hypothetical protein
MRMARVFIAGWADGLGKWRLIEQGQLHSMSAKGAAKGSIQPIGDYIPRFLTVNRDLGHVAQECLASYRCNVPRTPAKMAKQFSAITETGCL